MSKNLLFITSRLPWPIDSGRKTSLNFYCKGLHERYGYDVYLYCFLENGQSYNGTHPEYIKDVFIANEISLKEKIYNIISKVLLFNDWPMQCALFYSKENSKRIQQICNTIQPKVIFTEMIRTANYIDSFNNTYIKKIANLDDLLSKRYSRQIQCSSSKANFTGNYSRKLPKFINIIINNSYIKNKLLSLESKRCNKWEKIFYNKYDYCMFTSKIESDEMNSIMKGNKAITLSVGVDYENFTRNIPNLKKESNSLSFLGNFNVAANVDSLKIICENILPKIRHSYRLYVIGSVPSYIKNKFENDNIVFMGRVDDIVHNIRKTQIFLSPIAYGTGIKTKIVEAMAMGMPVVTNDIGAEGISAEFGQDLIVENTYSDIANKIDELLDDPEKMDSIGKKAQEFSYNNYRWDVVYQAFDKAEL